ncbi:branched-chain amino acid ABC transporter permease [Nitratireductor soli]|uniref:branched-chain amino acid ABC transporter permease n=1 Tax=Nitratireductor soli TaxID=1670619 RepID=UPI00065E314E|nr:branched-chain amino acid ABC transporter permease [Nitratireductor soli]
MTREKRIIGLSAIIVAALALLPFVPGAADSYLFFLLYLFFLYTIIGQAWNLVAGYTGQISLGQHAFFGLGAYTAALVWSRGLFGAEHVYYFDPLTLIASGLVAAAFALVIGFPLLSKLRGDYFALGTLGFGEIVRVAFVKGGSYTGGPFGIVLPSSLYESLRPHYWLGLGLAAGLTLLIFWIRRSSLGLALVAIRDDEMAASSNGVNVLKYKLVAFALGAFFTGMAGCLQAYYLFHVSPEGFLNLNWTLYPILIAVIGGSGTVLGPVIGALAVTVVFSYANIFFPELHPIFSGLAIILVMLFMPNGIMRLRFRGRA